MSDPNKRYGPTAPDTPLPSPQALKPTNTQTGSLYHTCRSVLDRLTAVDGMTEYLESVVSEEQLDNCDPLSKLTLICRRGFPLCKLYNALNPVKKLSEDKVPKLTMANSCKANVYHFIVACRNDQHFPEEDMFTISDLYQDDTNGFVKVRVLPKIKWKLYFFLSYRIRPFFLNLVKTNI
jgi:cell division control protein 24